MLLLYYFLFLRVLQQFQILSLLLPRISDLLLPRFLKIFCFFEELEATSAAASDEPARAVITQPPVTTECPGGAIITITT